jgi:DNA-binding transcriptional regulator GbsR (MarR family)
MDRATAIFVDGIGAASATSGILTQLQGRIFALLYVEGRPMSLDEIAAELHQSKSNISTTIRNAVEWHLVRRANVPGSRKDHYEAATDFWRVMQEIMERRIRWTARQVVATVEETTRIVGESRSRKTTRDKRRNDFTTARLQALGAFFAAIDQNISELTEGGAFARDSVMQVPAPPRLLSSDEA